jgi:hypothetical protein
MLSSLVDAEKGQDHQYDDDDPDEIDDGVHRFSSSVAATGSVPNKLNRLLFPQN